MIRYLIPGHGRGSQRCDIMYAILVDIFAKKKGRLLIPFLFMGVIGCIIDYSCRIGDFALVGMDGIVPATLASWTSPWNIVVFGTGGMLLGIINQFPKYFKLTILSQTLIGGIVLVFTEFIFGIILNTIFGLHVWDYTNTFLNVLGQIQFKNSILFIISVPLFIWIIDNINWLLYRNISTDEWCYNILDNYKELLSDIKDLL